MHSLDATPESETHSHSNEAPEQPSSVPIERFELVKKTESQPIQFAETANIVEEGNEPTSEVVVMISDGMGEQQDGRSAEGPLNLIAIDTGTTEQVTSNEDCAGEEMRNAQRSDSPRSSEIPAEANEEREEENADEVVEQAPLNKADVEKVLTPH